MIYINHNDNKESVPEWAARYETFPEPFKLKDGESKTLTFLDNGKPHQDRKNNKEDIVFLIEEDGVRKAFYVNAKSYSTLADIKDLGFPLIGKTITMSRKGSGRFDTRYTVTLNPNK